MRLLAIVFVIAAISSCAHAPRTEGSPAAAVEAAANSVTVNDPVEGLDERAVVVITEGAIHLLSE